jgi:flagellar basal-body rod modification protein FlgD
MTTIPSLASTANPGVSATSVGAGGMMDQSDFLRLMTTQLTTQDPFNPMDNTQMVAQMAQFSQVAGIAEMGQTLQSILAAVQGGRLSDAAGWIGRSALVTADVATPLRDGAYAGELNFDAAADEVSLAFVDASGATVHTINLGAVQAGATPFQWDGRNAAGQPVGSGPLQVVVTARAAGSPVTPRIATWTAIGGIQSPANGGASRLVTGLGLIRPEDALRLS